MLTDPREAHDRWPGHVEALGPVFQEARRVLRDGGTFYLAELHPTRQFGGTQAHFEDEAGFAVREMGEWRADGDEQPRLLSIRFGAGLDVADLQQ
ncbi:SAM-dependent methyltransferase [Salinibacter ruber]|uniref:SAM-dependent methyltransferase n=1 Tax=Salinibacter ruber TaxID=146919 RepID=A0A9X2V3F2_9BACT|nr:hypothetical protein [Salinibacter ruber]MCS3666765.1 SAM-dependent methyltransferase [Salinibacter ruber]MCS4120645.1 SAM-dependent methyltransferase [Salinibacter ruber]